MKRSHPYDWRSPQAAGGFSLLEMLIVIMLLSIFVVMALPTVGDAQRSTLRNAADVLLGDLAVAQIESISHRDDVRVVVFDTVNHGYHIGTASAPATPITHPVSGGPFTVQFGVGDAAMFAGVTLSALSVGGDDEIEFGIYGELDQTVAATVTLSLGSLSITVTIDADTGEATLGPIS